MNYRVLRGLSRGHQYFAEGTVVNTSSFGNIDDLQGLIDSLEQLAKEGILEYTEAEVTPLAAIDAFTIDDIVPPVVQAQEESAQTENPEPPKKGKK